MVKDVLLLRQPGCWLRSSHTFKECVIAHWSSGRAVSYTHLSIDEDIATIQVYEETQGLKVGEIIESTNVPLSVTLGPGIIAVSYTHLKRKSGRGKK